MQVLKLCAAAGLVKLGRVAVDGTKVKATASKHKAMSYARMNEREAALEAQAREQAVKDAEDAKARLAERERKEQENGRRFGGNPPRVPDPEQAKPAPKAQRNFTDPESRIQKTADGFIQGYTAVLAVDDVAQVIVAQHVTPSAWNAN